MTLGSRPQTGPDEGQVPSNTYDWRREVTMPDDSTQTLADVLTTMRKNNLIRQAAFVRWLADEWYEAKQALAEAATDA